MEDRPFTAFKMFRSAKQKKLTLDCCTWEKKSMAPSNTVLGSTVAFPEQWPNTSIHMSIMRLMNHEKTGQKDPPPDTKDMVYRWTIFLLLQIVMPSQVSVQAYTS